MLAVARRLIFAKGRDSHDYKFSSAVLEDCYNVVPKYRPNFLASALTDPTGIHEPAIYSSRWVEDGSFTRLANVTIGYTFNLPMFIGAARGSRVYISGDNLALWTPYSGYDPEVHSQLPGIAPRGIDYLHYPRPRTWTGGLRVAF